jgi:hypothetical protein
LIPVVFSPKVYKYGGFAGKVNTKPIFKDQHKNDLHHNLPPKCHRRQALWRNASHLLGRLQGLLRKATPLRPQPLCGDANLLDVNTLKNHKKSKKKKEIKKKERKLS